MGGRGRGSYVNNNYLFLITLEVHSCAKCFRELVEHEHATPNYCRILTDLGSHSSRTMIR